MSATNGRDGIELNIAMDLVRVTEAAAISGVRFMGMGEKDARQPRLAGGRRQAIEALQLKLDIGSGFDQPALLAIDQTQADRVPPFRDIIETRMFTRADLRHASILRDAQYHQHGRCCVGRGAHRAAWRWR